MATKKKPAAKGAKKVATTKRSVSARSASQAQRSAVAELRAATKAVQLQVVCFTVLSVVFAVMAFWRYG